MSPPSEQTISLKHQWGLMLIEAESSINQNAPMWQQTIEKIGSSPQYSAPYWCSDPLGPKLKLEDLRGPPETGSSHTQEEGERLQGLGREVKIPAFNST